MDVKINALDQTHHDDMPYKEEQLLFIWLWPALASRRCQDAFPLKQVRSFNSAAIWARFSGEQNPLTPQF